MKNPIARKASEKTTPRIIYVDQGQFVITENPDDKLITTGMTECIGVCFKISGEPPISALAHFDGFSLRDDEIAEKNFQSINSLITKFRRYSQISIIAFGGSHEKANFRRMQSAVSKVFGKRIEFSYHSTTGYNPLHGNLTITSDGSFGTFNEVAKINGIELSQIAVEERGISEKSAANGDGKMPLIVADKIEKLVSQSHGT